MRLVLARFALEFDFELQPESEKWIEQKLFTFWEKPPLMVKIVPTKKSGQSGGEEAGR